VLFAFGCVRLQERLNGLVLLVELSHVGYDVLDDEHVRKGVDLDILCTLGVDSLQACERVLTIDVHGAGPANALSARTSDHRNVRPCQY